MKLATKKSYFKNLPEGKAPSKFLPFLFKLGYFSLLIVLIGIGIYFLAGRYLYFSGRGVVEVARVKISPLYGGTVTGINQEEGTKVTAGDVLAVIERAQKCSAEQPDYRVEKLAFEIRQKQEMYNFYLGSLYELKDGYSDDVVYRALEIGDSLSRKKHEKLLAERQKLIEKTELLGLEIRLKKEELEMLEQQVADKVKPYCDDEMIVSSVSGTLERITRSPSEYIGKGQPLFVIRQEPETTVVEAFTEDNNLRYLEKGKQVVVQFPDKRKSKGIITGVGSTAQKAVELEKIDYMPIHTKIRLMVEPAAELDREIWSRYDRVDVRIKGKKN